MTTLEEVTYAEVQPTRRRPGRKTNVQRAQVAAEVDRAEQSAKRFYADTKNVLGVLLGLVALIAVASFTVSFAGLFAAASWAVGDVPWLQIGIPVMLDFSIIAFTLALFIERERGESVTSTWLAIGLFATVSAASNVLHTLQVTTSTTLPQLVTGAIISGGAPLLLALVTDKIGVKVFKEATK